MGIEGLSYAMADDPQHIVDVHDAYADWTAAVVPALEDSTHWQLEWNVLLDAIRNDRPHNEGKRVALVNLADIMGRAAVH
jgi:hypothetical protein